MQVQGGRIKCLYPEAQVAEVISVHYLGLPAQESAERRGPSLDVDPHSHIRLDNLQVHRSDTSAGCAYSMLPHLFGKMHVGSAN
jgi:hypothetical protein